MPRPAPRHIESDSNAVFKGFRKILDGRGIRKYGTALVSGQRITTEVLRTHPDLCEAWISTRGHPAPPPALPETAAWYELPPGLFREIDVTGTHAPLLLVRVPRFEEWEPSDGFGPGCDLLVPFQDPENVGAVIRSAAAFGVHRVILLAGAAHPFHPRSLRASSGAVFQVPLLGGPSLDDLPPGLPIVALSPDGADIGAAEFPESFGLLPGIEGAGLPEALRARAFSIPLSADVESLNSATATAIALYIWNRSASHDY
jgi:tRNA G18 (ribose-2'-O)-methylase SpoU